MNEMNIKIEIPELSKALAELAHAITRVADSTFPAGDPVPPLPQTASPATPAQAANSTPDPVMAAPVAPATPTAPVMPSAPVAAPVTPPTPAPAPAPQTAAPVMPVAGAPTYTLDQISKAGAALVDAGKMEPLLALLTKYGVQAITQLQPAQYGVFATELRALGAQI